MHNVESLLLDTHIWFWVVSDTPHKIGAALRMRIDVASRRGEVYISAISVWELAMLEAKKRVTLSVDIRTWVDRALAAPGFHLVPLSPEIAIESTRLPSLTSADPADQILVATARSLGTTLVTRDRAILRFAKNGSIKSLDAGIVQ